MSNFKGTDGKWRFDILDDTFIRSEYGKAHIATMGGANWRFNEKNANALLISKAPEMLEMLELACLELESVGKKHWEMYSMMQTLIKEATEL